MLRLTLITLTACLLSGCSGRAVDQSTGKEKATIMEGMTKAEVDGLLGHGVQKETNATIGTPDLSAQGDLWFYAPTEHRPDSYTILFENGKATMVGRSGKLNTKKPAEQSSAGDVANCAAPEK